MHKHEPQLPRLMNDILQCPECGKPMRLTMIVPHDRYRNLDMPSFECECGRTESMVVARVCWKLGSIH